MSANESRLDGARRRVAGAKRLLAAVAAAGFLAVLVAARSSHPGQAPTQAGVTGGSAAGSTVSSGSTDTSGDDFGFDSGDFGSGYDSGSVDVGSHVS